LIPVPPLQADTYYTRINTSLNRWRILEFFFKPIDEHGQVNGAANHKTLTAEEFWHVHSFVFQCVSSEKLYAFLTSALDRGGQLQSPAALPP